MAWRESKHMNNYTTGHSTFVRSVPPGRLAQFSADLELTEQNEIPTRFGPRRITEQSQFAASPTVTGNLSRPWAYTMRPVEIFGQTRRNTDGRIVFLEACGVVYSFTAGAFGSKLELLIGFSDLPRLLIP